MVGGTERKAPNGVFRAHDFRILLLRDTTGHRRRRRFFPRRERKIRNFRFTRNIIVSSRRDDERAFPGNLCNAAQ